MGTSVLKPKSQVLRVLAALPAGGTLEPAAASQEVNVAQATELELLLRYARSADAGVSNALVMVIERLDEGGDGLWYRRTIENGTLTLDANYDGTASDVDATVKHFLFTGIANGETGLVTYG